MKINVKQAILMPFKEVSYDEEGNVKKDKNGNVIYSKVMRVVRHNSGYYPNK